MPSQMFVKFENVHSTVWKIIWHCYVVGFHFIQPYFSGYDEKLTKQILKRESDFSILQLFAFGCF